MCHYWVIQRHWPVVLYSGVNMVSDEVYQWLNARNECKAVLQAFQQPLISRQISKKTGIPQGTCSYIIATSVDKGLLVCLNPTARNNRLYWLTKNGHKALQKLAQNNNQKYQKQQLPDIDWTLYAQACYRHRSVVIKILSKPMRPSEMKRILRLQRSNIRISAGNIRDVLLFFLSKGIVRPVKIRNKPHLHYELTDLGIKCRNLLIRADAVL